MDEIGLNWRAAGHKAKTARTIGRKSSVFRTETEHIPGFVKPKLADGSPLGPSLGRAYRLRQKAELLGCLLYRNPPLNRVYFAP